jgi:hypothetical protein
MSHVFWSKNIWLTDTITGKEIKIENILERAMAFGQKTFGQKTQLLLKEQKHNYWLRNKNRKEP